MCVSGGALSQAPTDFASAIQELEGDHDRAVGAVRQLSAGGEAAATALGDRWSSLSPRSQRRALVALASLAKTEEPAVACLLVAARSNDAQIREGALSALGRAGPLGWQGLARLLGDSKVGDRAAVLLARVAPDDAIGPILGALSAEGGAERPALRGALATAWQRADGELERFADWLASEPPVAAVGSAALGLAPIGRHLEVTSALIEYAAPRTQDFATRWRLLKAASDAAPSDTIDAWTVAQLETANEWMIRQAAVQTLASRGGRAQTRGALEDGYPRVRAAAAGALSQDPESMTTRAALARKDTWPMVRAAAIRSLSSEPAATPIVVAAVDDPMSAVRVAAIEVLTRVSHDEGWERVHGRLRNRKEWPRVTSAAIAYVIAHCRTDAVGALDAVIRRAASPAALTDDINNAARAIVALRALGTPQAEAAIESLQRSPGTPPTLKIALEEPLPEARRCASSPP